MNSGSLIMAFLMGLTGSLHCAGMCGAIVWIMPFQAFQGAKRLLALAFYHLARTTAYATMAVALFSFRELFNPQVQQGISIVLGSFLLLAGVFSFLPAGSRFRPVLPWTSYITDKLSTSLNNPSLPKIAIAGFLNGLLPCGLVYMMLSASLSAGNLPAVTAFVYAFGLGTMPLLASITLLRGRLNFRTFSVWKFVPVIMFVFGCLFILRGLNLGIPYLSPKAAMAHGKIIHSCCHKK